MTAHRLTRTAGPAPSRRPTRNGVLQLGWPHFWLLTSILGGILALVGMAFLGTVLHF